MIKNRKRLKIFLFFLIGVLTLSIGYASISAINMLINGNGTASVNQNNFIVMMYTTYAVYIICKSLILPIEQTIISNKTKGNSGEVMGVRQTFVALGQMSGPLIAASMYGSNHYSVFYFSIIIYFTIVIVLLFLFRNGQKKETN